MMAETAREFKARKVTEEQKKYGPWASKKLDRPKDPAIAYRPVKTNEEIGQLRNVMIRGNYPASISDCYVVGINGNCGLECPVLLAGDCDDDEMQEQLEEAG